MQETGDGTVWRVSPMQLTQKPSNACRKLTATASQRLMLSSLPYSLAASHAYPWP